MQIPVIQNKFYFYSKKKKSTMIEKYPLFFLLLFFFWMWGWKKKKRKEIWLQPWWSSFPYYSGQLSETYSLQIDLSRSAQVVTSPGSSFLSSSDVGQWPFSGSPCAEGWCLQTDTLCPVHFQLTNMLAKFSTWSNCGVSKTLHLSMHPKLFPV